MLKNGWIAGFLVLIALQLTATSVLAQSAPTPASEKPRCRSVSGLTRSRWWRRLVTRIADGHF